MEVTINISSNNQPVKQLTESHNSTLPSLISALSRIKESTNSLLTDIINSSNKGKLYNQSCKYNIHNCFIITEGSANGDSSAVEDEDADDDEASDKDEKQNKKRKSSGQRNRKRLKR